MNDRWSEWLVLRKDVLVLAWLLPALVQQVSQLALGLPV